MYDTIINQQNVVSFKGKTLIMYTVRGTNLNNQNEHFYNTCVTESYIILPSNKHIANSCNHACMHLHMQIYNTIECNKCVTYGLGKYIPLNDVLY
jgi:saccharopine dehydrogenase-like NADP-dependent oxidoreductase